MKHFNIHVFGWLCAAVILSLYACDSAPENRLHHETEPFVRRILINPDSLDAILENSSFIDTRHYRDSVLKSILPSRYWGDSFEDFDVFEIQKVGDKYFQEYILDSEEYSPPFTVCLIRAVNPETGALTVFSFEKLLSGGDWELSFIKIDLGGMKIPRKKKKEKPVNE